jgi:NNMT/PNMT/TEMT family
VKVSAKPLDDPAAAADGGPAGIGGIERALHDGKLACNGASRADDSQTRGQMEQHSASRTTSFLPEETARGVAEALPLPSMADAGVRLRNADGRWNEFSSQEYWRHNYEEMQPEDREIIERVSLFFTRSFAHRDHAEHAIDVGSGANLYPALLMLPWADQILLTDYSENNLSWLRQQVMEDGTSWNWHSFWRELCKRRGYSQISEPRKQLREACLGEPELAGIARCSVFDLPRARWQLGTMFFVAESITQDSAEFRAAVGAFIHALVPGSPFAATFMAGSDGYFVAGTPFPAVQISAGDVTQCLSDLGAENLSVRLNRTPHRVRPGYNGMIVATGLAGCR